MLVGATLLLTANTIAAETALDEPEARNEEVALATTPTTSELEQNYQNALREREIELIQAESQLLETEQERVLLLEAQSAQSRTFRRIASAAAALFLLVSVLLWHQWRRDRIAAKREREMHTSLRESNRQLLESHEQLRFIDEQRRKLLRITTHDLKNPLGALSLLLDSMASVEPSRRDSEEFRQLVTSCRNDLHHAREVVERLVRAQLGESLLQQLKIRPVAAAALVEQAIALSLPAARRKGIALDYEVDAEMIIAADTAALREVLDNLLSNAVKYSPKGRRVALHAFANDECGVFVVRDEGPGLAAQDFAQLFHPFARLSAQPTDGESSSGLGLSIVRELVEAQGGTADARNRTKQGAEFEIRLPLAAAETTV